MFKYFKNSLYKLSEFRRFLKLTKQKKQVIFYAENESQWDFFEDTIEYLLKKKVPICYVTSSNKDINLKKRKENFNSFFIGSKTIRTIFFSSLDTKVVVMSLPDLDKYEIKRSKHLVKYIFIPHNVLSTHMVFREGAFDAFDVFFCSGSHHLREVRETENIYKLKKKELIKFGYSRIDKIIRISKKKKLLKNIKKIKILIAPSWGPNGLFETGAEVLISSLLKEKNYEITLRPHPDTLRLNPNCLKKLLSLFKRNNRIKYNPNIDSVNSYFENDILISDWSGAALEFAFGTLKPVIFLDLQKKINNDKYADYVNKPIEIEIRNKVGKIIKKEDYKKIPETIKDFINKRKHWKQKIFSLRKKYIYNVGKSGKVGADYIAELLKKNQN